MSLFATLGIVAGAGLVGGIINAFVSNNGDVFLPRPLRDEHQHILIFRPGVLGNALVGAFAAGVNWGLYGPFSQEFVLGGTRLGPAATFGLTLAALATAALVGFAGARWLTNEVDKRALQAAAAAAASRPPDATIAAQIAVAAPADAFTLALAL